MEKQDQADDVDRSHLIEDKLQVLRLLTIVVAVAGVGALTCGIVTIVLSSPHFSYPFTTGSGIWTGIPAIFQGLCGFMLLMNFNKSFPTATKGWILGFYGLGIAGLSIAPQHLSYSIIGFVNCKIYATEKNGELKCNPEARTSLLCLQGFGIVFALMYEMVAITTLAYLLRKRRLAVFTGNQYAGRCYCDCGPNSTRYNDILRQ